MLICDVVGTVVATEKDPELRDYKLLVVQPLDLDQSPAGATFLAVDQVNAGEGDRVLVSKEGGGARILLGRDSVPLQAVIVGVIDDIALEPTDTRDAGAAAPHSRDKRR